MTTTALAHTDVERRHDFVLLFDVQDGNPNGDPDAGNLPRVDPETTQGLVTDVSLKRKVRDWVDASGKDQARYKIYVQRESYLTETRGRVFGERSEGRQGVPHTEVRQWMCEEFFDIRMFGAVMSMREFNAGQVRGPLQLTFARSIDPILPLDSSIARVALERGERPEGRGDDDREAPTHGTLGRKAIVPYALYLGHGFFNPALRPTDRSDLRGPGTLLERPDQYVGPGPVSLQRTDGLPRTLRVQPRELLGQRSGTPSL